MTQKPFIKEVFGNRKSAHETVHPGKGRVLFRALMGLEVQKNPNGMTLVFFFFFYFLEKLIVEIAPLGRIL